ncbi:helix-turn-helix transcriptional regulator [Streptomyces sp. CRN 30]|uniref:helix-turn-helix transcriptional regulator n=1 Tax=Streptomyces sp. CRN 30 TaxID=3075613 RepID=UPI002A83A3EB|nr:helix-turn-helix transcriptional regulator [Streptomyces sp. CRN 30]
MAAHGTDAYPHGGDGTGGGRPGADQDTHPHGADRLCGAADRVYARAVRLGRVPRADAAAVPCLVDLGLLHPDPDDMDLLVPTAPQEVMARLLRGVHEEVSASRNRVGAAVAAVEWYAGLGGDRVRPAAESTAIRVLDGLPRIRAAMDQATQACTSEVLAVQPGGIRREDELREGLHRGLEMRRRGVRMRDLYTHVARHGQGLHTYMELMGDAAEARTLDEVVERLIVFDRSVAFIPANTDRTMALEVRHPALVEFLVVVFERLWRLGVPLGAALPATGIEGITHRERSIAALLAEGHQDAVVAERLGISVRTCRAHIARLSETLGAASRTQLGVRIAQAGLDGPPGSGPAGGPLPVTSPSTPPPASAASTAPPAAVGDRPGSPTGL